jgi:tetratricopeptide (TPR) repeat protein
MIKIEKSLLRKLAACFSIRAEFAHVNGHNHERAVDYYRHPIRILESLNNSKSLGMLYRDLGFVLCQTEHFDHALEEWIKAAQIFDHLKEIQLAEHLSVRVHSACWVAGELNQSISFAQHALEMHRKKGNLVGICRELNALGLAFSFEGNVQQSVRYFKEAWEFARKLDDNRIEERNCMGNLARTYYVSGQFEQAIDLYDKILEISKGESSEQLRARLLSLSNRGLALREVGIPDKALEDFRYALDLIRRIGDDGKRENRIWSSRGLAYRDKMNMEMARSCYLKAKQLAERSHDKVGEGDAAGHLGNGHYEMGQFEQAEYYYLQALQFAKETNPD